MVGRYDGKIPLRRPKRRREDVKMSVLRMKWGWAALVQGTDSWRALLITVMNTSIP